MIVFHVSKSARKLASMFMRLQEFYESPKFRGKIFTKKEFLDWYKEDRGTRYHEDWCGYNLPGWVIEVFRHGCFDPLSKDEQELINKCNLLTGSFYVIGTERGGEDDLKVQKHELAHALFYLDLNYRLGAFDIIKGLSKTSKTQLEYYLKNAGYHPSSFVDEMHAYVLCDEPNRLTKKAHQRLNLLYDSHVRDIITIDR